MATDLEGSENEIDAVFWERNMVLLEGQQKTSNSSLEFIVPLHRVFNRDKITFQHFIDPVSSTWKVQVPGFPVSIY
jgi:hypothetical protein